MIGFFRRIRKKMADDNKPMKYMRYAIGEILLVVIGILIALQVNNWNEGRKNKNKIKSFLSEIQSDLASDIHRANEISDIYIFRDSVERLILKNKITPDDIKNRIAVKRIIYFYTEFEIHTNGYEGLMRHADDLPEIYTPILNDLNKLFIIYKKTIDVYNKRIQNTVYENLDDLKIKDWSILYWQGEINEDMINYFLSDTYKKETINFMNDLRDLFDYTVRFKIAAINTYKKIANLIENEKKLPEYVNYSLNNPDILMQLAGHYQPKETNEGGFDELDFSAQKNQLFVTQNEMKFELFWHKNLVFFIEGNAGIINFNISSDGQVTLSHTIRGLLNQWTKTTNAKN